MSDQCLQVYAKEDRAGVEIEISYKGHLNTRLSLNAEQAETFARLILLKLEESKTQNVPDMDDPKEHL